MLRVVMISIVLASLYAGSCMAADEFPDGSVVARVQQLLQTIENMQTIPTDSITAMMQHKINVIEMRNAIEKAYDLQCVPAEVVGA